MSYVSLGRRAVIGVLFIAALLVRVPDASATPILTVTPSSSNVLLGNTFTVDFAIDDFTDLFSFQFGVSYDAALLSVIGVFEGSHLASAGGTSFFGGIDDPTLGLISFVLNSLSGSGPGANGGGVLFSVQFQAIAVGLATVTGISDPNNGDGLYDSLFNWTQPTAINGASISISRPTSVPEPATLFSFALGAAIWGAAQRKRRRRSTSE